MLSSVLLTGKTKDPFPPARIAAINSLAATQQYYTILETSGKVIPMLCPLLSDPEKPVREQAFKVIKIHSIEMIVKISEKFSGWNFPGNSCLFPVPKFF